MHLAAATVTTERQGGGVSPVLWPEMTLALLKFINGLKDTIVGITVHVRSSGKCGLKTRHQLLAQQWVSSCSVEDYHTSLHYNTAAFSMSCLW